MSKKDNRQTKNFAVTRSLRITIIYFIFGCLWIIFSDYFNELFIVDESKLAVSMAKGLIYVTVTAAMIFFLIFPVLKKVSATQEDLQTLNDRLEQSNALLLESQDQLTQSEVRFRTIFEQATIGIGIGNLEGSLQPTQCGVNVNPMFEKIFGRSVEELSGMTWRQLLFPDPGDAEVFEDLTAGRLLHYDAEKLIHKPDGTTVWIRVVLSPLILNHKANHICLAEDITRRKQAEQALYDSERSKSVLLENLPGMAYRCDFDPEWTMQFVSQGCLELTGYQPESLLGNRDLTFNDLILPQYRDYLWNRWQTVILSRNKLEEEYEIRRADGEIRWVWEQGQGVYDEDGGVLSLEGLILDITDRKNHEMRLKYLNEHDMLTGLYNRLSFEDQLSARLQQDSDTRHAVLLINIRKFSQVNITRGYQFGETLIRELAASLSELVGENMQLFQVSIDRFALCVCNYPSLQTLQDLAESVQKIVDHSTAAGLIQVGIGILEINDTVTDVEQVLKYASIAAENEQLHSRGYCFFNCEMEQTLNRREVIKNELARAARAEDDGGLYMNYQPVINLKTRRIYGFEALARFTGQTIGNVSPAEFIPIAEETRLIVPLGKKIMRQAFAFLRSLEDQGYGDVSLSFNVSAIQLLREEFFDDLRSAVTQSGVDPTRLVMEITESVFSNSYQAINEKLELVKQLGIQIALDDFGTGYSSLSRERELNINCMKIDKQFIDKLLVIDNSRALTGDIISMAHKMGHYVIAEGVESERQREYLLENQCDYMQGFLFSKPLSPKDALQLLSEQQE